jgi:hypothetical protein
MIQNEACYDDSCFRIASPITVTRLSQIPIFPFKFRLNLEPKILGINDKFHHPHHFKVSSFHSSIHALCQFSNNTCINQDENTLLNSKAFHQQSTISTLKSCINTIIISIRENNLKSWNPRSFINSFVENFTPKFSLQVVN